jgi:hypothetical protein
MTQALYAHMNNKTIKIKKKKESITKSKVKKKSVNVVSLKGFNTYNLFSTI